MKKILFLLNSMILVLSSCNSDEGNNSKSLSPENIVCTFDFIKNTSIPKPGSVIINSPRWETGQTIKIKFLDGTAAEQEIVKKYADEWTIYANLKFEYVSKEQDAHIKIAINMGNPGAWSQLGSIIMYPSPLYTTVQNTPTMRLGAITDTESSKRTILHEFGHALGLKHEMTNPDTNIKWDLPKVYSYYYDLMDLSKEEVDRQIINKPSVTNYSQYDPLSIMHYYVPAYLTTDRVAVYQMSVLSKTDKESITKWYPFPVRSIIETGERIDIAAYRKCIKSPNGRYSLEFDSGCLFILDSTNNQKVWSVGAPIYNNAMCFFQKSSGEIIISGSLPDGFLMTEVVWRNHVSKVSGAQLHLQDNGNLELIQNGIVKWSSKNGKI
ncbi:hypothetical protein [Flavobacterium sp.]|uniref:hypothetical protein n=1 Tax=Flavobacterium sp. TaxID=239 RepID=UPI0031E0D02A